MYSISYAIVSAELRLRREFATARRPELQAPIERRSLWRRGGQRGAMHARRGRLGAVLGQRG